MHDAAMKQAGKVIELVDQQVGARVRARRKLIGMSQETLATHIGVTFQQVQKYEKGTNRIGSSRLHQIAAALGVPVSALFADDANPMVGDHFGSSDSVLSKDALDLNKAFLQISDPKLRKAIIDFLLSLTRNA